MAEIDVHGSYVGSDRFGRLRGPLGTTAADRDLNAGRVSRFRDLKAETGGPPNDDEMTVSCGHEPSCVCRFVSGFKAVLITRATTVKSFSFVAIARPILPGLQRQLNVLRSQDTNNFGRDVVVLRMRPKWTRAMMWRERVRVVTNPNLAEARECSRG